MGRKNKSKVKLDGCCVNVTGKNGEKVQLGPDGVHVQGENAEVNIGWTGIQVLKSRKKLKVSIWKPLVGCAFGLILIAAIITVVVAGIIKLMM